jgi:hypothetical protein
MSEVGDLVCCVDGRSMIRPPEFCPAKHRLSEGESNFWQAMLDTKHC